MARVRHGSACTTPRVRAERQASQEATRILATRYGLNPKTVAKWRGRTTTADLSGCETSLAAAATRRALGRRHGSDGGS